MTKDPYYYLRGLGLAMLFAAGLVTIGFFYSIFHLPVPSVLYTEGFDVLNKLLAIMWNIVGVFMFIVVGSTLLQKGREYEPARAKHVSMREVFKKWKKGNGPFWVFFSILLVLAVFYWMFIIKIAVPEKDRNTEIGSQSVIPAVSTAEFSSEACDVLPLGDVEGDEGFYMMCIYDDGTVVEGIFFITEPFGPSNDEGEIKYKNIQEA